MKKPKITQGEWKYEPPSIDRLSQVGVSAGNGFVNIYSAPHTTETKANAKAISAVPDMMHALIIAVDSMEYINNDLEKDYETLKKSIQISKKVLKKSGVEL